MFRQIMTNCNTPNNVSETRWILTVAKPISWWNCVLCHPHVWARNHLNVHPLSPSHHTIDLIILFATWPVWWTCNSEPSLLKEVANYEWNPRQTPRSAPACYIAKPWKKVYSPIGGEPKLSENEVRTRGLPRVSPIGGSGFFKWLVHKGMRWTKIWALLYSYVYTYQTENLNKGFYRGHKISRL